MPVKGNYLKSQMSFCFLALEGPDRLERPAHLLVNVLVASGTDLSRFLLLRKKVKVHYIYTVFCSPKGTLT